MREPEGNGGVERFIRTLKENLLWVQRFATIEELRQASKDTSNEPACAGGAAREMARWAVAVVIS